MLWRSFSLGVLLALPGCGSEGKTADSATDLATDLATVAGEAITAVDLDRFERALPDYLRLPGEEGTSVHRAHLQSLVDKELLLHEARKRGLDQLPSLVQRLSEMVNKRLVEELSREITAGLSVTEEELRSAYEAHLLGWEIWPAHILSASEEDASEIIRLLGTGVGFSKLASQRSLADDADKGGDLGGFFGPGDAVPNLREGVFRLEEGQVSEPIRTMDGYEVVKVIKKRRIPLEKLQASIVEQLIRRKGVSRRQAVVDSLKEARGLRYHRDRIHAVLDGLHRRGLDPARAQAPLIEYSGGAIKVSDAVQGLRDLDPPDSATAFQALELRIIPDSLLTLEARALGRHQRGHIMEWKEKKRQELIASQLRLDEIADKVEVTDAEVRAYYDKFIDTYTSLPGFIQITEVLCDTRAEAEAILARARAGERLEQLAVRHSVRPGMKPVGGHAFTDSGRVTVEPLYQSPYRTIFGDSNTEDVGVLQGPLEVQDKYSVFRLDQPVELTAVSFRQVRRPIRVNIRQRRESVIFNAFLDSLHRVYANQVQISEEALSRYAAAR